MRTDVKDVGMVVLGLVLIVMAYMASQRVDKYLQIRAMAECSQAANFIFEERGNGENGNQTTSRTMEPNHGFYKTCIEDMGYKTKVVAE